LDRHDRQIAAIRTLMQEGVRFMIETRKDLRAIAAMQKRTDAKFEALIDSLRRGRNGHAKARLDIE
jgi:hypothetical protein